MFDAELMKVVASPRQINILALARLVEHVTRGLALNAVSACVSQSVALDKSLLTSMTTIPSHQENELWIENSRILITLNGSCAVEENHLSISLLQ